MTRYTKVALLLLLGTVLVLGGACSPSPEAEQALTTAKQIALLMNPETRAARQTTTAELAAAELLGETPTPSPTPHYIIAYYEVQPGDTLWAIAERFGVSMATLQVVNELENQDHLALGQELLISERVTISGEFLPTATPTPIPCYAGCLYREGDCAIKGVYARLDGTPMYLLPDDPIYPESTAEIWFCREEDAQREGWWRWTEFGPAE